MNTLKIAGFTAIALLFSSCVAIKTYERPQAAAERLYRTDNIPTDSLSSAMVPWREIFTDTLLQQHLEKALANNLDIRVALQNVATAQATFAQSRQALLPTLSASAGYSRGTASLNANPALAERSYSSTWSLGGTAAWEADIWGRITAQKRANYASYLATVSAHQAVMSEVVATLATSYYQLLMYDKQLAILESTVALRRQSLETTRALKEAGTTTEVAVQQSEALLYNAQAQIVVIKNAIWALENAIAVLLGEEPRAIERSSLEEQTFPTDFKQGYTVLLLENRPDVMRAEANLISAFEMTNAARAAFYPSLRLTAQGGLSSLDLEKWLSVQSLFASVAASLTQPIFNQRQIRTQHEIRKYAQETALLAFQKTLLTAGKEVSDAMRNFSRQEEYIVLKTQEMEAYQKATEYSRELFNSGLASYLELITAEVNRLNAELSVANARFAQMQYGIALYKALGGGWR